MSFLSRIINGGTAASAATSSTRSVAKERLSVILASQRGSEMLAGVNMEDLQRDVMEVVEKHIQVAKNKPMKCNLSTEGDVSLFEMSVEVSGRRTAESNQHQ